MTSQVQFTRIVLGLSGEISPAALSTAAEMARTFGAELAGLYVEDEAVLAIADLPFCMEIAAAGSTRPFGRGDAESAFRTAFAAARRRLESAARDALVKHSFARERGSISAILQKAARADDIIILFESDRAIERACLVDARYVSAAFASRGSLLYVPASARSWRGGITACLLGQGDREVLHTAVRIAVSRYSGLTILAAKNNDWRPLLAEIVERLGSDALDITERRFSPETFEQLKELTGAPADDLLVVARDPKWFSEPGALNQFAIGRRAPVLLIEPQRLSA